MQEIIGVKFKKVGKIYFFDPNGLKFNKGDNAIVETARGIELGEVAVANRMISEDKIVSSLKKAKICHHKPVIKAINNRYILM